MFMVLGLVLIGAGGARDDGFALLSSVPGEEDCPVNGAPGGSGNANGTGVAPIVDFSSGSDIDPLDLAVSLKKSKSEANSLQLLASNPVAVNAALSAIISHPIAEANKATVTANRVSVVMGCLTWLVYM